MGMGGGSCAKGIFYLFNFILWLSGAALLGVGVWLIVDESTLSYVVSFITEVDGLEFETDSIRIVAYLFIAVGAFVFVVGFCGCCGAVREVSCLLGLYIFFLVLVIAAEIAAGALVAYYRTQLLDKVDREGSNYIQHHYMGTKDADKGLHYIQHEWECCGVKGHFDYRGSSYSNLSNNTVSLYCCTMVTGYEFDPAVPNVENEGLCMSQAATCIANNAVCSGTGLAVHSKGCHDAILDWVKEKLPIFIGIGCGIGAFEIIVLVTAVFVCRQAGKEK